MSHSQLYDSIANNIQHVYYTFAWQRQFMQEPVGHWKEIQVDNTRAIWSTT